MSTHCLIAIRHADGTAQSIYCHCDGYPSHTGPVLLNHFNTYAKVVDLISGGDVSRISSEGVADRSELPYASHDNLNDLSNYLEPYNYLFDGTQWILFDRVHNNDALGVRVELCA
jgi:hypothetical protein